MAAVHPIMNFKEIIDHIRRYRPDQHISGLLIAIVIGILSGYGAVLFRFVIKGAQYLFYQNSDDILTFAASVPAYVMIGMPALGGLIVGILVHFGAREAKGHGVPEVMEAVSLRGGHIRKRVAFVKIIASAICIGSGGSVGREGPIVQIGSSIGSSVSQIFKLTSQQRKTMVGCGAAAGIAATFNAPIAGVLFALEVLLGDFGIAAFSPVVLSSVMATTISRHYFGDFPAFVIPSYELVSLWELIIYPFLGLLTGVLGILFITVLYKSEDLFDLVKIPEWIKPAIGGLIIGAIFLKWPEVFGVGYGAMNMALLNEMTGLLMLTLIFVKMGATSITLGTGGSGGIFAPSLFMGGMVGGFFGWVVNLFFPEITAPPAAYALVGMGAFVAGVTHAPITAILIIFEMTGNYKIILPMMITAILSTIVASSLKSGSIYTIKLLRRGVNISKGLEQNILKSMKVRQIMEKNVVTVPEGMPLVSLISTFKVKNVSYLHMVNKENDLTGIISFRDIRPLLEEEQVNFLIIAKDVATTDLVIVGQDDNIQVAMSLMGKRGIAQLPVTGGSNGRKILGTLREKDVIAAYDNAVIRHEIELS
jgi:CIC family chloride channel protein